MSTLNVCSVRVTRLSSQMDYVCIRETQCCQTDLVRNLTLQTFENVNIIRNILAFLLEITGKAPKGIVRHCAESTVKSCCSTRSCVNLSLDNFLNGKATPLPVRGKMQVQYVGELQTSVSSMFIPGFINSMLHAWMSCPGTGLYLF